MYLTGRMIDFKAGTDKNLVLSALSGRIFIVSDAGLDEIRRIGTGEPTKLTDNDLASLTAMGFLFPDKESEEAAFVNVCEQSLAVYEEQLPHHFTFILNAHCNFSCPYCFEPPAYRNAANTMTRVQVDKAFDYIEQTTGDKIAGEVIFEIFGGEPLLPEARPVFEYLLSRIAERGCSANIQTNGYYLADNMDLLAAYRDTILQIQVTLDGPARIHNQRRVLKGGFPTFDRIAAGIDTFIAAGQKTKLKIRNNLDKDNITYIDEMVDFYRTKNWDKNPRISFVAAPVDNRSCSLKNSEKLLSWDALLAATFRLSRDSGNGPLDLSIYKITNHFRNYFHKALKQPGTEVPFMPKAVYCEATTLRNIVFHPNNRIFSCPEAVAMDDLSIGEYFPELRLRPERTALWKSHTILNDKKCARCGLSTLCGGGCVLSALLNKDSSGNITPYCEDAGEIIQVYLDQING